MSLYKGNPKRPQPPLLKSHIFFCFQDGMAKRLRRRIVVSGQNLLSFTKFEKYPSPLRYNQEVSSTIQPMEKSLQQFFSLRNITKYYLVPRSDNKTFSLYPTTLNAFCQTALPRKKFSQSWDHIYKRLSVASTKSWQKQHLARGVAEIFSDDKTSFLPASFMSSSLAPSISVMKLSTSGRLAWLIAGLVTYAILFRGRA